MSELALESERALMRLTLELAWLIESADSQTLDRDTGDKWLEDIAAEFQDFPDDAKLRLTNVARELAAEYRGDGWTLGADFFDRSPDNFGFGLRRAGG